MTRALRAIPTLLTAFGASLPGATKNHRGQFVWKRASGSEDEIHAGVVDSSNVAQFRRILTKTYADTLYRPALSSNTGWTSAEGAAMGSSPGSISQAGAEHSGRVTQTSGGSGTTTGILWTITLATNWGDTNYNVYLTPQNAETARCIVYPVIVSGTQFTINAQVAPNTDTVIRCGWLIEDRTP